MKRRAARSLFIGGIIAAMVLAASGCIPPPERPASSTATASTGTGTATTTETETETETETTATLLSAAEYYALGAAALEQGAWEDAITNFDAAVYLAPDNAAAYAGRAEARYYRLLEAPGDLSGYLTVIEDMEHAVSLDADITLGFPAARAYSFCGDYYTGQAKPVEAIAEYESALETDATVHDYIRYGSIANLFSAKPQHSFSQEECEITIAFFDAASERDPEQLDYYLSLQATVYFYLGQSYTTPENATDAIAAITTAIELNPRVADYYFARAEIYYELAEDYRETGNSGGAEYNQLAGEDYTTALETSESEGSQIDTGLTYYRRGLCRMADGDHRSAINDFTLALLNYAEPGLAYYQRGRAYWALGNITQARSDFSLAEQMVTDEDILEDLVTFEETIPGLAGLEITILDDGRSEEANSIIFSIRFTDTAGNFIEFEGISVGVSVVVQGYRESYTMDDERGLVLVYEDELTVTGATASEYANKVTVLFSNFLVARAYLHTTGYLEVTVTTPVQGTFTETVSVVFTS